MNEAKAIRLLQCAEKVVRIPDFQTKEESDAWLLANVGDITVRELGAVLQILDLLDTLDA